MKTGSLKSSFITIILAAACLLACSYQPNGAAKAWNPYQALNVLIFESSQKQRDSIFINQVAEYRNGNSDVVSVNAELVKRSAPAQQHTEGPLLTLTSTESGPVLMSISLHTGSAVFGPFDAKRIGWLDSLPKENAVVNDIEYKDVLILQPDSNAAGYQQASATNSFVKKIWWSKTKGLIQYEMKDSITWKLVKKYML